MQHNKRNTELAAAAIAKMQLPSNNYNDYNYNYNDYNYFNYNYAYNNNRNDSSNNRHHNRRFQQPATSYGATTTTNASVSLTSTFIALLPTTMGMLTALLLHSMLLTATTAAATMATTSTALTTTTASTIMTAALAAVTKTTTTTNATAAMSAFLTTSSNIFELMYDITTSNYDITNTMNASNMNATNAVNANANAIDAVSGQRGVSVVGTAGINGPATDSAINFNESDELSEKATEYIFDRTDVRIIFITLYSLVFCCCFFGNLLVILVVTLSRRLRSITNFFLANLALADFCVGLFCVMQNLSIYLIDSWVFGEFLCRMYQFVHSLSYTASIFILVVICMERYFAIVHPITCKQILTAARLRMVILTVWITSAVYSTPKFVFSKTIKNIHTEDGQEEEICVLDRKMFNSKLLDMINFVLLYAIPLLVMTVLYSKIAIALWRSSRGLSHHMAQQQDGGNDMGLHNSMYHHQAHHHPQHQLNHQQQSSLQHSPLSQQQPPDTPIMGGGSGGGGGNSVGSLLSRKQSSKYEKRGVSITESQVSLEADRPIVSTCRSSGTGSNKASFYLHHPHHPHQRHGTQRGAATSHMSHSSSNVLRARRGVVRMLIIFVLTFALCNLPYHARKMWQYWSRSYRGDSNFNALLTPLTFLVSYFNSGVNPLLYAFLSRNFRKGMKELLLCSWKKGKGKSSTNSSMHHKRMALQTHSLPTDTTHIGNEQL